MSNVIINLNREAEEIEVEINEMTDDEAIWCLLTLIRTLRKERGIDLNELSGVCALALS